jgi:transcription elongation factor Elf1
LWEGVWRVNKRKTLIIRLYREFTEDVFTCMYISSAEVVLQSGHNIFLALCGGCISLCFCSCIYVDLYKKIKYCYSAFF